MDKVLLVTCCSHHVLSVHCMSADTACVLCSLVQVIEIFTVVMNTVTDSIISSMQTVHRKYEAAASAQIEREIQTLYKKTIEKKKQAVLEPRLSTGDLLSVVKLPDGIGIHGV